MAEESANVLSEIHIEQNVLKENVGSQDQVAAAFGGLNKIEFKVWEISNNIYIPINKTETPRQKLKTQY